jgi:exo-beta-1,3-glucanase (GH17 family)
MNNFGCPWGATYSAEQLEESIEQNDEEIGRLITLARQNEDIVFSVAVGNEATVDWTDHFVPVQRMIELVRRVKLGVKQPVTFCENYVPWQYKLHDLVEELDFISVHTYPVWEFKHIHEALDYTRANYESVVRAYPHKPVIISEAGWATNSNGRGIQPHNTSQDLQDIYIRDLLQWSDSADILTFVFEAFDEPWKGSPDPLEPEKHWGLFTVDREPKLAMRNYFESLLLHES